MTGLMRTLVIGCLAFGAYAGESQPRTPPTAEQLVAKNVAARGGLESWRKVHSMVWSGHLERSSTPLPGVKFVLDQERPNRTRFGTHDMAQTNVRVFDGTRGWKVRSDRSGNSQPQPYTLQEVRFARGAQVIDGPLIDSAAKGNVVAFEGTDAVAGRPAYRLSVRLADGEEQKVWIDAQTFLDVRFDRIAYGADGKPSVVSVYYRDYRRVDKLMVPGALEVGVGSGQAPDRMVIEQVTLNPPLDAQTFSRPLPQRRNVAARQPDATPQTP